MTTLIQGGKIRRFLPTTVTFTAIGITSIDIFAKKHADVTWNQDLEVIRHIITDLLS